MRVPGYRCLCLHGALAEFGRQLDGLPACRNGAVEVPREPEDSGHLGQHPSQSNPVVKRSSQGLGLAQQGEVPPILSQSEQRASQREAELDGQHPGIAVLGQVRQAWRACSKAATASRNAARS